MTTRASTGIVRALTCKTLRVGINELPTCLVSGIKPTVNRFGGPGGPLFELDNRFSRDLRSLFRNRQKSCDQAFLPVRILRVDQHGVAIGVALRDLEHILAGGEHVSGNLHGTAERKFRSLVPLLRRGG